MFALTRYQVKISAFGPMVLLHSARVLKLGIPVFERPTLLLAVRLPGALVIRLFSRLRSSYIFRLFLSPLYTLGLPVMPLPCSGPYKDFVTVVSLRYRLLLSRLWVPSLHLPGCFVYLNRWPPYLWWL